MLCVFIALIISLNVSAQKSIGIEWEAPQNLGEFQEQLTFFQNYEISLLILDHQIDEQEIEYLDQAGIPYIIRTDNRFVTAEQFEADSLSLVQAIQNSSVTYDSSSAFKGIIGFSDSDVKAFRLNSSVDLYFERLGLLVSGRDTNESLLFFRPQKSSAPSVHTFAEKLSKFSTVIVPNTWFESLLNDYPEIERYLSDNQSVDPSLIPLPESSNQLPVMHWSIVVLLFLWVSLGVNVGTNPTYLEIIPRYFTAHRFFVDDIMSYRDRSSRSSVYLLFQHPLFGGLVVYILSKIFISTKGLEALYYHLPYLGVMGQNYFSLFVLTSVIIFVVELIALLWIYLPNKAMTHFNQPLNLFTWIFHLDFIIVTLLITAFFADLSTTIISILAISYLIIWFSSFNITALGASKRLGMARNSYLFKTIGIHTLVSITIVVLLINFDGWWDLLQLVVSV